MVFGASFTPKNRHVDDARGARRESVYLQMATPLPNAVKN